MSPKKPFHAKKAKKKGKEGQKDILSFEV